MEQNLNHLFGRKETIGSICIAVLGVIWIFGLKKPFPYLLFGTGIWLALVYGACVDFKIRRLHDGIPVCVGVLGALYCTATIQPWMHWGLGLGLNGIVMGMLYAASQKAIGLGDVKLLIVLGVFLGPLTSFYVLFHASWISALTALGGIAVKKMTLRQELPFVPFIAAGYLLAISSL